MNDELVLDLWRALTLRGLSDEGREALSVYESSTELYNERFSASMLLGSKDVDKLLSSDLEHARNIAAICDNNGIRIYLRGSDEYPKRLEGCAAPPEVLFSLGSAEMALNARTIAVVGSRDCDDYSLAISRRISADLAKSGFTIVSGFARGIDTSAHLGALDAGGSTVAVLGCGLLSDYPRNTKKLKELISRKGAVISEFLPNEQCLPNYFLDRNAVIAGISDSLLCTQAALRSGTLNTVGNIRKLGKPVYVTPPHDIYDENYAGVIKLLREGCTQVYSAGDIIAAYTDKTQW